MLTLVLRTLAMLALFQALAVLVLLGERRGRGAAVAAVVLAVLAGVSALVRSADPALLLASAVLAGLWIGRAVRRGATVWRAARIGLVPVVAATALTFFGTEPRRAWSDLERQVQELAGPAPAPPSAAPGPEERALLEQYHELAVRATTWTMRLLPAEIVVFDLVQVLVVVAVAGWLLRGPGRAVAVLPVSGWKVPFGIIWVLALGLALAGTRLAGVAHVGWNVVLVATILLSVQGVAVFLSLLERSLSAPARWVVLCLAVLTPLPFTVTGTALLGIADLWLDFRRRAGATDGT